MGRGIDCFAFWNWRQLDTNDDSFTVSGKLIIPPPNNPGLRIADGSPLINNEIEELPTELSHPTELSMTNEVPNFSSAGTFPNPPKQVKGYIWSNEPIDKSKEVIGDVVSQPWQFIPLDFNMAYPCHVQYMAIWPYP
ncbi:hypothetical protein O181_109786 [Austropuccinia psidii MF-1]|uniref:Uncharacterized protein n=1 Tax=Austropuccinia psidii MF-1 TaxID=1389203 RepID=A0A9Q3JXX1_9BASI|nr:hypothetical protein [Austropuccinia psidii MF-1]